MATPAAAQTVPNAPLAPGANAFPMHPSGSLYVGDLANDVTEAILFEIFNRAGAVSSIRVCRDATTRRSLGYAYVNFHSMVDAERALDTLNFQVIKDRPCRIMWSHRDPSIRKNSKSNIFIKNLAPGIDSKQLYDTFSKFGNILSCKVATDASNSSKGFGYVHFENEESATKAIENVNGHTLAGKAVFVGRFERRTDRTTGVNKYTNVYVKHVPIDWNEEKLKKVFESFGEVTSVALRTGEKSGFGFVNFASHEQATAAVDEGRKITGEAGQNLFVDRFQKKGERLTLLSKMYDDRKRERLEKYKNLNLYVKNLDDDVDEAKLKELFAPHGEVTSLVVMRDDKGASRGFGFVCFANSDDASKALTELNGKVIGSKPLYVNRAQRRDERRVQLEHIFMAGQRMQPVTAMYFPPNMPMQHLAMFPPQFRRLGPQHPGMRGFPTNPTAYFPGGHQNKPRGGGRNPPQSTRGAIAPHAATRGGKPGMRGGPNPRYQRDQPQAQPGELSAAMLANASPEMQKQILGERLYPLVFNKQPELAAKITGMFLEMDTAEILTLLDSQNELDSKIQEALVVLQSAN